VWEQQYNPDGPHLSALNLFIDHPGMGWHNVGEPGINRRGINAGINALRVRAMQALADLEEATGDTDAAAKLRDHADALADLIIDTFYDRTRAVFADGELDGKLLDSVSQQTNTWMLQAIGDRMSDDDARRIMQHVMDEANGDSIARGGPYFWIYIYPVMQKLGMAREALELTRRGWGRMIDGGASTLWETWAGDDLDTACHPWSAPAIEFLLTGVLGLPREPADNAWVMRPRYDLLAAASGRICLPCGDFEIAWTTETDGVVSLRGCLPPGVRGVVEHIDGQTSQPITGAWNMKIARATSEGTMR
jgi:alpha-L-rhamnosidase